MRNIQKKLRLTGLLVLCAALTCGNVWGSPPSKQKDDHSAVKNWSSPDDKYVLLNIPAANRSYYFDNNRERLCFTFSVSGLWGPTKEPGLLKSSDGNKQEHVGVLLLSRADLARQDGADLLARAVALHLRDFEELHKKPANNSEVSHFKSAYAGSIKWTGRWHVVDHGHIFLAQVVRYMAVIKPGWVAIVTASHGASGDNTARAMLESLKFTSEPGCYHADIRRLRQQE
jgi:hypothetical protein